MDSSMLRQRKLHDPVSAKTWETVGDGNQVHILSGKPGKQKRDTKRFETDDDARKWAEKQEWARLKKGFVLVDAQARPGEPSLLCYLGGAYTGAMTITRTDELILCNRYLDDASQGCEGDELIFIDAKAGICARQNLSSMGLLWEVRATSRQGQKVLRMDTGIFTRTIDDSMPTLISERTETAPGFFSIAGTLTAWHAAGTLEARDLSSGQTLLRQPLTATMHGGHTPQMAGALSPDGRRLAVCSVPGEIQYLDVLSGEVAARHQGDFEMIAKMHWTADGRWIIALETYGKWRLMCFDAASGEPRPDWTLQDDMSRSDFAISTDGSQLAITHRGHISIYDLSDMKIRRHFRFDHVVRSASVAWTASNAVSVRTDYGCVGTYIV